MPTAALTRITVSAPPSGSTPGPSGRQLTSTTPEDLAETLRLVLERGLREQEQRLLAALRHPHGASRGALSGNFAAPPRRICTGSASSKRQRPEEQERTHSKQSITRSKKCWAPWRRLATNFGWPAPSGIKTLENTRDSELLESTKSSFRQCREDEHHDAFTPLRPEARKEASSAPPPIPSDHPAMLPGTMPCCQKTPHQRTSDTSPGESDPVFHSDQARTPMFSSDTPSRPKSFSWEHDYQILRAPTNPREALGQPSTPPMQHSQVAANAAAASTKRSEPLDAAHRPREGYPCRRISDVRYLPALAQSPVQPEAERVSAANMGVIASFTTAASSRQALTGDSLAASSRQALTGDSLSELYKDELGCAVSTAAGAAQGARGPRKATHCSSGRGSSRFSCASNNTQGDRRAVTPSTPPRGSVTSRSISPPTPSISRILSSKSFSSDSQAVRLQREDELLREFRPVSPRSSTPPMAHEISAESDPVSEPTVRTLRWLASPLLLRLCGILPWGRLGEAHCWAMRLLASGLAIFFTVQFHQVQSQMASPAGCLSGICMPFEYLSDLILATGSALGLVAMHQLTSLGLLGSETALLVRCAIEHEAVWKWSAVTSRHSLYLTILWLGTLVFRAVPVALNPGLMEVALICVFAVTNLIFMGLVFSILHVSGFICIVIDSYVGSVRETMDIGSCVQEWDKLGALLRTVSRAMDKGFLIVQTTLVTSLLCSFGHLWLHESQQTWWFASNMVLALSLLLIFSKAAEVTEMCTRVPSLINSLDFGGDEFSPERHYLVEHIIYSAAGFYVGEVRLTAGMALKLLYMSILVAFGVLTKLTAARV